MQSVRVESVSRKRKSLNQACFAFEILESRADPPSALCCDYKGWVQVLPVLYLLHLV